MRVEERCDAPGAFRSGSAAFRGRGDLSDSEQERCVRTPPGPCWTERGLAPGGQNDEERVRKKEGVRLAQGMIIQEGGNRDQVDFPDEDFPTEVLLLNTD